MKIVTTCVDGKEVFTAYVSYQGEDFMVYGYVPPAPKRGYIRVDSSTLGTAGVPSDIANYIYKYLKGSTHKTIVKPNNDSASMQQNNYLTVLGYSLVAGHDYCNNVILGLDVDRKILSAVIETPGERVKLKFSLKPTRYEHLEVIAPTFDYNFDCKFSLDKTSYTFNINELQSIRVPRVIGDSYITLELKDVIEYVIHNLAETIISLQKEYLL